MLEKQIKDLISPALADMGYDLVQIAIVGGDKKTLQIMAEPSDGSLMSVDACAEISRHVSALMDVEDPIENAYRLEVSSPGLDRPLVRRRDYEKAIGLEAKIGLKTPTITGQRRFRGRILSISDTDVVTIEDDHGEENIALSEIQRAKLVLTDELLAIAKKQQKQSLQKAKKKKS